MSANTSGRFFPVQGVHLGSAASIAAFNSATLPFDVTQGPGSTSVWGIGSGLGMVVEDSGKVYRLVRHHEGAGAVATVAGGRAVWKTRASFVVSMDITDAEAGGVNDVAGAYLGVVTHNYYCFVQIGGLQTLQGDGSVAAGEMVSGGSATDGEFDTWATTELPVAVAWAADSGTPATFPAYWLLGNML